MKNSTKPRKTWFVYCADGIGVLISMRCKDAVFRGGEKYEFIGREVNAYSNKEALAKATRLIKRKH